jgi:hypothetical protein
MAIHVATALVTAAGGTSLRSGEVELMLHRRLLYDDRRGVAEPLNETACGCQDCACDGLIVRGTHLLTFEVYQRYVAGLLAILGSIMVCFVYHD